MRSILPATWEVPEKLRARLGESAGRQRAMQADGHLLLVLHAPPGADDRERVPRFFWRQPGGQWMSNAHGSGGVALRKHLDEFTAKLEQLEDDLQQATSASDYFTLLQNIAPLCRTTRNLHNVLQEAREAEPDERELISLRDLAGVNDRAAELLQTDAQHGLDYVMARAAEEQSRRSYEMTMSAHRLNIMAAIFFPLATLATVFGMNIRHGLEDANGGTFWAVLAAGGILGLALAAWILVRPKMDK